MLNKYKDYLTEKQQKGLAFLLTTDFNKAELKRMLDDIITKGQSSAVAKQFLWLMGNSPNALYEYKLPFKTQKEASYLANLLTWDD